MAKEVKLEAAPNFILSADDPAAVEALRYYRLAIADLEKKRELKKVLQQFEEYQNKIRAEKQAAAANSPAENK